MRYSLPLAANTPTPVRFKGRNITIMDIGVAAEVDLKLNVASVQDEESFGGVGRNFTIYSPAVDFIGATFTSTVATTVDFIVTNYRIETIDGTNLTATISAAQLPLPITVDGPDPLPVQTDRGDSALNPMFVSGTILGDTPADTLADNAAVAAGDVAALLLAAAAGRLEAVIFNQGPDAVALGMVGITWAKRAIVLEAGDTWVEARGAAQAWYVITDAGNAASVTVQERLA